MEEISFPSKLLFNAYIEKNFPKLISSVNRGDGFGYEGKGLKGLRVRGALQANN